MVLLELIRGFLALELTSEVRDRLEKVLEQLPLPGHEVKWVEPENLHVTLYFLGSISKSTAGEVTISSAQVFSQLEPFIAEVKGIGFFPPRGQPRVIWAGISAGEGQIKTLQGLLAKALAKKGFEGEKRPFHPHVTLGRFRNSFLSIGDLKGKLEPYRELEFGSFSVKEVSFFKSFLTPRGPVYTVLERFPLGGKR